MKRRRVLQGAWAGVLGAVAGWVGAAGPADVAAADARRVRSVVQAQLDAFAAGDAARAFTYAAPAIREMFGTAERFMEMVERRYAPVIRPASVTFLVPQVMGDSAIQGVTRDLPDHPSSVLLTGVYHNLLREWAEV